MGKNNKPKKKKTIEVDPSPVEEFGTGTQRVMSKKQIRARARRAGKIHASELEKLYKPLEEWDEEELARGRPKAADGTFRGSSPSWITREMHEAAMARFKGIIEGKMRGETVTAMKMLHTILTDEREDDKGRPVVSASTKLDAAKFLIEHAVGKPTQRQEMDISVRLQGLLAAATVGPGSVGPGGLAELASTEYDYDQSDDDDDIEDAELVG